MEAIMPPAVEQPSADQLIVVHNLHHPQAWQPLPGFVDEYVDRRSPLGNPYVRHDGHVRRIAAPFATRTRRSSMQRQA